MVDEVVREPLYEGHRHRTIGGGRGGRQIGGGGGGGGGGNILVPPAPPLPRASVEGPWQESYGGEKKIFPGESGKSPGRGGKKLNSKILMGAL